MTKVLTKDEAARIENDERDRKKAHAITYKGSSRVLSHIDIWKKAVRARPHELFVVLEDDVRLHYNFDELLSLQCQVFQTFFDSFILAQYYTERKTVNVKK